MSLSKITMIYREYIEFDTYVYKSYDNNIYIYEKTTPYVKETNKLTKHYITKDDKLKLILTLNKISSDRVTDLSKDIIDTVDKIGFYYKSIEQAYYHKITLENEKYTGKYVEWYDNGNIYKKLNYIDGKLNGICCVYNVDGKISSRVEYMDNLFHGEAICYSGNKVIVGRYVHGVQSGEFKIET